MKAFGFLFLPLFLPLFLKNPSISSKGPNKAQKGLRPSQVPAILRFSRQRKYPLRIRIALLKKAIQSSARPGFPKDFRLLLQTQLGMLFLAVREPQKALKLFDLILETLGPRQVDLLGRSLLGRGQALVALGKKKEALKALKAVEARCPGTVYSKQAQKTTLILRSLTQRQGSKVLPKLPLRFKNLWGKKTRPRRARLILMIQESLGAFLSSHAGEGLAKAIRNPSSLVLAFAEDPKGLGRKLRSQIQRFEKNTGFPILFLPTETKNALTRLFPLQAPKSILFSLEGRALETDPSPSRCAAFVIASEKRR
jgi:tetratricopeptide (TPR) repeat protein